MLYPTDSNTEKDSPTSPSFGITNGAYSKAQAGLPASTSTHSAPSVPNPGLGWVAHASVPSTVAKENVTGLWPISATIDLDWAELTNLPYPCTNGERALATTHPISNSMECDQLQAELRRLGQASEGVGVTLPLPEMTFGNNLLKMEYRADGKFESKSAEVDSDLEDEDEGGDIVERRRGKSDWLYQFDTLHALLAVKTGELEAGDGGVKVNYAEEWLKNRTGPSPRLPMPKTVPTTPYDWTYTTSYQGHSPSDAPQSLTSSMASMSLTPDSSLRSNRPHWYPSSTSPSPSQTTIPLAELTRPDPILFYAEVPLFEDELHDNGSSAVVVRIRVMPTCIFILSRFTLRVDGVLFRTFDTRLYSSLEYEGQGEQSPMVIRETSGWEAPYESVRARLPKHDDLTPLTDPGFIAKVLSELPQSQTTGAGTGWRELGRKCEWARL
ncbi:hypothetical protein D9757_001252 [Collybiopsis confluens]|uniref:Type 2A phosphatase activator TIP41 n=1 Tax=Collybiopsis confluens TaxID=2823264 RepID=A0A8H5MGA6_9AGAR|nr:hypothetical protein D9757_001252 [Collybiopsis confluens]